MSVTNPRLFSVLRTNAEADRQRALMSLELLSEHPAGIGDHSTGDFYKNAEEALSLLADAEDRLETLAKHFGDVQQPTLAGDGTNTDAA